MFLYFYTLNSFGYNTRQRGILVKRVEAVEKPKTYRPLNERYFPNYMSFIKKEEIGHAYGFDNSSIVLTEPNLELAKSKLRSITELRIKQHKDEIARYEEILKAIEESEDE